MELNPANETTSCVRCKGKDKAVEAPFSSPFGDCADALAESLATTLTGGIGKGIEVAKEDDWKTLLGAVAKGKGKGKDKGKGKEVDHQNTRLEKGWIELLQALSGVKISKKNKGKGEEAETDEDAPMAEEEGLTREEEQEFPLEKGWTELRATRLDILGVDEWKRRIEEAAAVKEALEKMRAEKAMEVEVMEKEVDGEEMDWEVVENEAEEDMVVIVQDYEM